MLAFVRASGDSELSTLDNAHAPSGVKLEVSQQIDAVGGVFGGVFDLAVAINPSDTTPIEGFGEVSRVEPRRFEAYLDSARLGRIALGYGPTASAEITETDLSGTRIITNSDLSAVGGEFIYDDSYSGRDEPLLGRNTVFNDITGRDLTYSIRRAKLREAYSNLGGLGDEDRLRYDSPVWGGWRIGASLTTEGAFDLVLNYRGAVGGYRLHAALGAADQAVTPRRAEHSHDQTIYGGSFSLLAPYGASLGFAVAVTEPIRTITDYSTDDQLFYYVKLGQEFSLFDFGLTSVSADYGFSQSYRAAGEDVEKYGLAISQAVPNWRMSLYASVHTTDLDETGFPSNFQPVDETQVYTLGVSYEF